MFRMSQYAALAAAFLIILYFLSPAQLPVVLWKAGLLSFAGFIGYWLDRHLFPYARPHMFFSTLKGDKTLTPVLDMSKRDSLDWVKADLLSKAMLRRAIIVAAVVIGFALGV